MREVMDIFNSLKSNLYCKYIAIKILFCLCNFYAYYTSRGFTLFGVENILRIFPFYIFEFCSIFHNLQKICKKFIEKFKMLNGARLDHETVNKGVEDSCREENRLTSEIVKSKLERKRILCAIKSIRDAEKPTTITQQDFDKLLVKHKKLQALNTETRTVVECFRQRICQAESEKEVVRNFARSQLDLIRLHNDWGMSQLSNRKNQLLEGILETIDELENPSPTGMIKRMVTANDRNFCELQESQRNEGIPCSHQNANLPRSAPPRRLHSFSFY